MKINIPVRMKNIWFWIGLSGVVMSAMGVNPEMFTSWDAVIDAANKLIENPYMLGSVIVAIIGVFNDPTTHGLTDSSLAMTYTSPKED